MNAGALAGHRPAYLAENPHAGQGPVLLELGEDTGALVLTTEAGLLGREIEIRSRSASVAPAHAPHAAVILRPLPDGGAVPAVVYPDLAPAWYLLRLLPAGPSMPVRVTAGRVTTARWAPGR